MKYQASISPKEEPRARTSDDLPAAKLLPWDRDEPYVLPLTSSHLVPLAQLNTQFEQETGPTLKAKIGSFVVTAVVMLALDMTWLGAIAAKLYDQALHDLARPEPYVPAAMLFYTMYVTATWVHAVNGATSIKQAAARALALGVVCYGTFDLTCWAVLRGWPGWIVPIDMAWGGTLTTLSALIGRWALQRWSSRLDANKST
jgi:uncharacterized membrane protein